MIDDPIIEEIYQARQKIMQECHGDLKKLMEHLKAAEAQHPHRMVSPQDFQKKRAHEKAAP
jgi:hypothetical protein